MSPFSASRRSASPVRLAYDAGDYQFGELYLPDTPGPYPVAILVHGGYWRARFGLDLMHGLAQDLAGRGIAVWNIEYRRVGNPGGGWPGTFLDVANAVDFLREVAAPYALDLHHVVPIGHSAGGHLACWLAARSHAHVIRSLDTGKEPLAFSGAISLAGVLDLHLAFELHLSNDAVVELLGASPSDAPERYTAASPASLLPLDIPQVLIHGTADTHVPLQVSQRYASLARAAGDTISYFEPEGVDHFDVINSQTAVWELIVQQLQALLRA